MRNVFDGFDFYAKLNVSDEARLRFFNVGAINFYGGLHLININIIRTELMQYINCYTEIMKQFQVRPTLAGTIFQNLLMREKKSA